MTPESISFSSAIAAAREDLAAWLETRAAFTLVQDRDPVKDHYVLKFHRKGRKEGELPFPEECAVLLPRGDSAQWKGATVFDGIPIELFDAPYVSIGLHEVLPHRTRNCYVRLRAFLIDAGRLEQTKAMVENAIRMISLRVQGAGLAEPERRAVEVPVSPFDPVYAFLVIGFFRQWRDSIAVGRPAFMRTLCLSEHMTPQSMARSLEPYISKASISLLRDQRRHIVNLPPAPVHNPRKRVVYAAGPAAAAAGQSCEVETKALVPVVGQHEAAGQSLLDRIRSLTALLAQLWRIRM
jgi:hypothetical protein